MITEILGLFNFLWYVLIITVLITTPLIINSILRTLQKIEQHLAFQNTELRKKTNSVAPLV